MPNNITPIARGREIVKLNEQIEAARITFLLAMVNPVKPGDTLKRRIERTFAALIAQFEGAGYDFSEAVKYVNDAHDAAYLEYLKV